MVRGPIGLAVAMVGLALAAAPAATLRTGDNLALVLSDAGRVTGLSIGGQALPLKGEGGFAVADFAHQPEPTNLVPNPGFEDGPKGWSLEATQHLDPAVAHGGKASVRLDVPGPEPGRSNLQVIVPVKPFTHYRVGLWMRRHGVPVGGRGAPGAYSSQFDERDNRVGAYQVGGRVPTEDDVWRQVMWDVVTLPETRKLLLRGDLFQTTGTVWIDDFFVYEYREADYHPVSGSLKPAGDGWAFSGEAPADGLAVEATFRPAGDHLRIDGAVRDTRGVDRAVGLRFALPLDLTGWRWFDDAEDQREIAPGRTYSNTYDGEGGIGRCSVYPWSALSGPNTGLSLALPLDQGPRVYVIQHDQAAPETALTCYFGLTRQAAANPSRGSFSFVLYRHDPTWGMRSAMERYYRLFPQSFVKRPTYEGYLGYGNLEVFRPATHELYTNGANVTDASDFGEGYHFVWHMHGCYDYRQVASDDPKMPSDETVLGWLNGLVEREQKTRPPSYVPTAETIKKLVHDANGHIRYIFDTRYWRAHEGYNGTDQPGWGLNFRVNEDPAVSGHLAAKTREVLAAEAARPGHQPWNATLTADAIEGYSGPEVGLDYRLEHLATTTFPPTFGRESLKPAVVNTIWDFHHQVWGPLTQQYQVLTYGNGNVVSSFFTMPFIDLDMVEGRWGPARLPQEERFWRATAHHKLWRYWVPTTEWYDQGLDEPRFAQHLRHGLAGAIFPSVYEVQRSPGGLDGFRAWYRRYIPAMEELSASGWEPVPYARATGNVVVERFGAGADGTLHLTLRNYSAQPADATVTLDRQGLGLPAGELFAADLLSPSLVLQPVPASWPVTVEADGSRAFWIGTRRQAAGRALRLARTVIDKVDRLFATELDDASRRALADGRKLTEADPADQPACLRAAEALQAWAEALPGVLKTASPVDLAKLLFRLRVAVSGVPVALLELPVGAPERPVPGLRGEGATATVTLPPGAAARLLSPWGELARPALDLAGGTLSLPVPDAPARALLPYVVVGKVRGATVALPVDVQVGPSIELTLTPKELPRGVATPVTLTASNRLGAPAALRVKLDGGPGWTIAPAEATLSVPARGTAQTTLTLTPGPGVTLGVNRLRYTVAGDAAKFSGEGAMLVRVVAR